jgi:hypothetical protein
LQYVVDPVVEHDGFRSVALLQELDEQEEALVLAQDGVRGSINYDANDRFCLDGQRLVAISGTYGADGTEYRTEIESFSKVISRGGVRALHSDITAARPEQPTLSRPRTLPG